MNGSERFLEILTKDQEPAPAHREVKWCVERLTCTFPVGLLWNGKSRARFEYKRDDEDLDE